MISLQIKRPKLNEGNKFMGYGNKIAVAEDACMTFITSVHVVLIKCQHMYKPAT